ncbi:MAG: DegV family EDD domain-containing protein [Anaerolineae bacterium]|nr:DegV family EDD domain-containing protein [Anaerolineae bacterium]
MSSICILTDSAVQFTQPGFAGRSDIRILTYDVALQNQVYPDGEGVKATNLPPSLQETTALALIPPSPEKILEILQSIALQYKEVIAILTSTELNRLFANAEKAAASARGHIPVTLIDSQTTNVGLGLLVQLAAECNAQGLSAPEIERRVRKAIPRVYTLICSAGLSYLSQAGFIDHAQATVGEMLNLISIFSLEEGKLSAIEKARNLRGVIDFFQEFLGEFDHLSHISLIQGIPPFNHESHILREHAQDHFSRTPFSEHTINLPLATLVGPRTLALVIMEAE